MVKVKAREGEEVWENTLRSDVWVGLPAVKVGGEPRSVLLRQGQRLRLTTDEREITQSSRSSEKKDIFRNGVLRRVDVDNHKEVDPEYQEGQALTDEDLVRFLEEKKGPGFKGALADLNDLNLRRLKDVVEDENSSATQSQRKNVLELFEERFPAPKPPASQSELLGD